MTAVLAILILLNFCLIAQPLAQHPESHLVPLEEVRRDLVRHSSQRTENIQEILEVVRHEEVQKRVGQLGDLEKIEVALASLDEATLEELATQSRKINDQIHAGISTTAWVIIAIAVVVVIVLAIIIVPFDT